MVARTHATEPATAPDETVSTPDRRQVRHDAKRARIVAEAWNLARRDGLGAISLRDLAERVDLRQPSLYAYFDSKLALYEAMFSDAFAEMNESLRTRAWSTDPDEALVEFVEFAIQFAIDDVVRHQLLFQRTIPGFKPPAAAHGAVTDVREFGWERLQAVGVTDLPTADIFTALVSGLSNQQVFNDPYGDRWRRQSRRVVEMFLADVRQRPVHPPDNRTEPSRRTRTTKTTKTTKPDTTKKEK